MKEKVVSTPLRLRPAVPEDAVILRRWDNEPHIIAAKGTEDWEWEWELPRSPKWRAQLIAEYNGNPIGFLQIVDPALEESHYWGECPEGLRAVDIWIGEREYTGRGIGTQMMIAAINRCFAEPEVGAIIIDPLVSNTRARRFYERLGFKILEFRSFGDSDCVVYRLERSDWEE